METLLQHLFSERQLELWAKVPGVISAIFSGKLSLKHLLMSILFVIESPLLIISDSIGIAPAGQALDLSGYELVFSDEFEGNSLNTDDWYYRANGPRRGGFDSPSQIKVEDGKMVITGEYRNGEYGEGWYAGAVALKEHYTRGYFEIRCICNKDKGYWSAFWLQSTTNPYDPEISKGGVNGAEIDIFEAMSYNKWYRKNSVESTIHCSGMAGDTSGGLNSKGMGHFLGNDIYNKYNTYGCEWTEDEYIFYINGIETSRTSWADGVSTVPEEVIVSLELPGELDFDKETYKTEYIIDYVKIYQKTA